MAKRNGWITLKGIIITAVVIVLALGVWGGVKLAQERGEQARRADAVREAEERLDEIARSNESEAPNEGAEDKEETTAEERSSERDDAVAAGAAGDLPQTGPGESMAVVALASMAFAVGSFVVSRRQLKQLAFDHL